MGCSASGATCQLYTGGGRVPSRPRSTPEGALLYRVPPSLPCTAVVASSTVMAERAHRLAGVEKPDQHFGRMVLLEPGRLEGLRHLSSRSLDNGVGSASRAWTWAYTVRLNPAARAMPFTLASAGR